MFTRNKVRAAAIMVSELHARRGTARAIIVNAGISNVATGVEGVRNANEMTELAARKCGIAANEVIVGSTGIIGHPLPMEKIRGRSGSAPGIAWSVESACPRDIVRANRWAGCACSLSGNVIVMAVILCGCSGFDVVHPVPGSAIYAHVLFDAAIAILLSEARASAKCYRPIGRICAGVKGRTAARSNLKSGKE